MRRLTTAQPDFAGAFEEILARGAQDIEEVSSRVRTIIKEVRSEGDEALMRHISTFDRWNPTQGSDLLIAEEAMERAYNNLDDSLREALYQAYERIKSYHEKQMPKSWLDFEENGSMLGVKVTAVERAGLYIPGGKAAYPSSLLMNAIPALVAGVDEIVVCTPTPDNEPNELLLAACWLCGVSKVYKVGGASAIAAMAYGTQTIPKVDVITGPGNIYVATAKKLVYGDVNIDMIAGPSEIGILADASANPNYIAIDLLSQAEHDEMASSILITDSSALADAVESEVYKWLQQLSRKEIAERSIHERGAIIVAGSMEEAVYLMNKIAPEHLEVMTANPFELLPAIKHAGAIFLGENTPEPIGDYIAGPNHTLPTGSTARFYSPLSVEHFLKRSSIIAMSKKGIKEVGEAAALIAATEGLTAHEASVRVRLS
ncbi:MAG: histidinol dehydrogenase [Campylobacterales bacterium]